MQTLSIRQLNCLYLNQTKQTSEEGILPEIKTFQNDKRLIHQGDIIRINMYLPNNTASHRFPNTNRNKGRYREIHSHN